MAAAIILNRGRAPGLSWRLQATGQDGGGCVEGQEEVERAPMCGRGVSEAALSAPRREADVWTMLLWCRHQQEHGPIPRTALGSCVSCWSFV